MRATCGVFRLRADAERAVEKLQGLDWGSIILLVPGDGGNSLHCVPVSEAEQPGMGKALGMVIGAVFGFAGGFQLVAIFSAAVASMGLWWGAIVGFAGAVVGAAAGGAIDHATTDGLPRDELFVYEDALRNGRSVVLALTHDLDTAKFVRRLLVAEGAESVDRARRDWWSGVRTAEQEGHAQRARDGAGEQDKGVEALGGSQVTP